MKIFPVDSLSSCLNNVPDKILKRGNWGQAKHNILKKYKFHLAFENQCEMDYVTEKVWLALASGTLAVYYGAPNIKDLVPTNSMIFYEDFETDEDLVNYMLYLQNNKTAYNLHHEWRHKPLEEFVIEKYKHVNEHVQCRMCRWVASKDLNLTWDKHLQDFVGFKQVQEGIPYILHQTAKSWNDALTYSYREECEAMYRKDQWTYLYWNDDDISHFVKVMFPEFFDRWDAMTPHIRKIDTVRYMWMHHYGGIYIDADAECVQPATKFVKAMPIEPTAWLGGFPEPFFLMSTPGHPFWMFVVESILKNWKHLHTRRSSGPQGLNRWAIEWVRTHGLDTVRMFELKDPTLKHFVQDGKISGSWRWFVSPRDFISYPNASTYETKIGFLPNEVVDPTSCLQHMKSYECTKHNHCGQHINSSLFVHHCHQSHGI